MSGLEVAGVLLGTFPLIIAGIEQWRKCATVGNYFRKVRKEYTKCRSDVQFHEIMYRRNLKALLKPIVVEAADVEALVGDPGGDNWKDPALQENLVIRLQESYSVYMEIIEEMNDTAEELRQDLCFGEVTVQQKLAPSSEVSKGRQSSPSPARRTLINKSTIDYQFFRAKFAFGERKRKDLFAQLKDGNERLDKLLSTSDNTPAVPTAPPSTTKHMAALDKAFKKVYERSGLLFRALQRSWDCTCKEYHYANLRLDQHRSLVEDCFEIILTFIRSSEFHNTPWSWREFQCNGHATSCKTKSHVSASLAPLSVASGNSLTSPQLISPTRKKTVSFQTSTIVDPTIPLCQLLGESSEGKSCMGVIGDGTEVYHLHPQKKREEPIAEGIFTLDFVLSPDFEGNLYVAQTSLSPVGSDSHHLAQDAKDTPLLCSLHVPSRNCKTRHGYEQDSPKSPYYSLAMATTGTCHSPSRSSAKVSPHTKYPKPRLRPMTATSSAWEFCFSNCVSGRGWKTTRCVENTPRPTTPTRIGRLILWRRRGGRTTFARMMAQSSKQRSNGASSKVTTRAKTGGVR
jgi:hypothetical protein